MTPETPRIFEYITKSTWLHFEDALQIGKLKLFAGKYQNGAGASDTAAHYLDDAAARPILHDMLWSKQIETKDYKGQTKQGQTTSRVLSINTAEKGYYFELSSGPGKETKTGAVMPAGKPDTAVNVFVPFSIARQIAADVLEYLAARRVVALMFNYNQDLLDKGETIDDAPAAIAIHDDEGPQPEDEFDKLFPRKPDPAADAKLHQFKYKDGKTAPNNEKTRAIFTAYYNQNRTTPASGPALNKWWKENKPAEDSPAES